MRVRTSVKPNRLEIAILIVTIVFAIFVIGFYCGRNSGISAQEKKLRVETEFSSESFEEKPEKTEVEMLPDMAEKLNLNTATLEELTGLPGIGEKLAGNIVAYRESVGDFVSPEELLLVEGIGEKKYAAIRDLVTVGGSYENIGSG